MSKIWIAVLLLAFSVPRCFPKPNPVSVTRDSLQRLTTYGVKLPIHLAAKLPSGRTLPAHAELEFFFTCMDRISCFRDSIAFEFNSESDDWRYIEFHPILFSADGADPFGFDGEWNGTVGSGYVLEHVSGEIRLAQASKIASAKSVQGRIGIYDFTLGRAEIEKLRALLDNVPKAPEAAIPAAAKLGAPAPRATDATMGTPLEVAFFIAGVILVVVFIHLRSRSTQPASK